MKSQLEKCTLVVYLIITIPFLGQGWGHKISLMHFLTFLQPFHYFFKSSSILNKECWWTIKIRKWDLFNVGQIQIWLKGHFVKYCTFYILAVLGTNRLERTLVVLPCIKTGAVTPNTLPNLYHPAIALLCSYDSNFCYINNKGKKPNSFEFCVEALNRINSSITAKPNFLHCHFEWIKVTHILAVPQTSVRTWHFSNPPFCYN